MRLRNSAEWRTVLLIVFCYFTAGTLVVNPFGLPLIPQMLLLIPLITLHSSLQHECLHGHPFQSQRLNDLIIYPSIGIFLPYFRFKDLHMKHHHNAALSDPYEDPESYYLTAEEWEKLGWIKRQLFRFNNTLSGRMLVGPALSIWRFTTKDVMEGDAKIRRVWLAHILTMAALLSLVAVYGSLPVWAYLICCYGGYSLLTVRTFLEHQAHESIRARTVINEDRGLFAFLFLNNNLHVVHHAYPALAWYRLPSFFKAHRDRFITMNRGYYFQSYAEIFRKFAFKTKEPVAYPLAPGKRG